MPTARRGDWAGKILGFFFGATILVVVSIFVIDRATAILTPKQYAASKAMENAEAAAASAQQAEVQRKADAAQAKRDEAQRKEELVFNLASDAFSNFKSSLRDPRGAQFRDVWAVRGQLNGTEIIAACGVVNAQNAFGGYTGETPFMAAGSFIYTPDHPSFEARFQTICLDGKKVMKLK
jgi:hypothetical protein